MCSLLTGWLYFGESDALLWLMGHLNLCSEPYTHADSHTCMYINSEFIIKERIHSKKVWIKHCCSYWQVRKKKPVKEVLGRSEPDLFCECLPRARWLLKALQAFFTVAKGVTPHKGLVPLPICALWKEGILDVPDPFFFRSAALSASPVSM